MERRWRALGWLLGGTAAVLGFAGLVLDVAGGPEGIAVVTMISVVSGIGVGVFGAIMVDHQPRNRAAWAFLSGAVPLAAQGLLSTLGVMSDPSGGSGSAATLAWGALTAENLAYGTGPLFLFLFPDGHLPVRRWWPVFWLFLAVWLGGAVVAAAGTWAERGPDLFRFSIDEAQPVPDPVPWSFQVSSVSEAAVSLFWLVALVSLIARYRRRSGAQRQQLLWALWGSGVLVVSLLAGPPLLGHWAYVFPPVPFYVAVTIAMRRHGLFDADRLVRRTVSYTGLTIALAGIYGIVVVALGAFVDLLGLRSAYAVAGSTLVTAAAFGPLRRWLQQQVDRRFDRRTAAAVAAVQQFAQRLQQGDAAPQDLPRLLADVLGDPSIEISYILGDGTYVDGRGEPRQRPGGHGRAPQVVQVAGRDVAIVDLPSELLETEPALVKNTLTAAALPLENAALHARTAVQLADIRASRARIVAAGDTERRRIERDLHDGAQQRLVALALNLRTAERRANAVDPSLGQELDQAVNELRGTVDDLRYLTTGMLPPVLASEGLAIALASAVQRLPIQVDLDVTHERFTPAVEATAWFVACEAMANAAKHAEASRISIQAQRQNGRLVLQVSDDGQGGARITDGGGLQGLADRVAAADGVLRLNSSPATGTTLEVELPCES